MGDRRRIAIVGARPAKHDPTFLGTWRAIAADVEAFISALPLDVVVVSGGAAGVDTIAAHLAKRRLMSFRVYLPDYDRHGVRGPLERNTLIVSDCDELHAWPAPWSRGTWDTVRKARDAGKPTFVHEPWKKSGGVDGS